MFWQNPLDRTVKKAEKYFQKGDLIKSKEMYVEALALDPDNIHILNNLSQIYRILDDYPKAKGYSEILLKRCDEILEHEIDEEALLLKTNALVMLDRKDEAYRTADEVLKINPDNIVSLFHKAHYLEKNNENDEALEYFEKILKHNPYDMTALLSKGRILAKLGEYENAEDCFNLVFEMDPKNKAAINLKSALLKDRYHLSQTSHDFMLKAVEAFEMKDFASSKDFFKKALEMSPEYDEIWFAQGELFIRMGHIEDAIESFEKAFEINPRSGGIEKKDKFFKMLNRMKKINSFLGYEKP